MKLTISSSAFAEGGSIPKRYTCDGQDVSPPLEWTGVPAHSKSLVLIVDDPDAPDPKAPQRTWVHWVLYNVPANVAQVAEGADGGGMQGLNDWRTPGYRGPCPPIGRHRYFFKLYALDAVLPDLDRPTKARLLSAMQKHVMAEAHLVGTYERIGRA